MCRFSGTQEERVQLQVVGFGSSYFKFFNSIMSSSNLISNFSIAHPLHQQDQLKPVVLPLSLVALLPIEARSWRTKSISSSTALQQKLSMSALQKKPIKVHPAKKTKSALQKNNQHLYQGKVQLSPCKTNV